MSLMGDEARRLRDSGMPPAEMEARLGVTKQALTSWLARRPLAKDESRAVSLRRDGWSVNDIALELGVARSTAWLWVRHLPLDPSTERARAKPEHSKLMTDARWMKHRADRDAEHERVTTEAAAFVGELSEREILLLGTAIYWCEGSKSKPWRRSERIIFTNSDPHLIRLFLTFLRTVVDAAGAWWAEQLGVPIEAFRPPTIKRHKPSTNRKNNGEDYHGCLVIDVARGRHLYWHVEGLIAAMAGRM